MTINPNDRNISSIQPRVQEILPEETSTVNQVNNIAVNQGITKGTSSVSKGTASRSHLLPNQKAENDQPIAAFFRAIIFLVKSEIQEQKNKIAQALYEKAPGLINKPADLKSERKNLVKNLEQKMEQLAPLEKEYIKSAAESDEMFTGIAEDLRVSHHLLENPELLTTNWDLYMAITYVQGVKREITSYEASAEKTEKIKSSLEKLIQEIKEIKVELNQKFKTDYVTDTTSWLSKEDAQFYEWHTDEVTKKRGEILENLKPWLEQQQPKIEQQIDFKKHISQIKKGITSIPDE